jgi:PAS domain S-box-containing protein
MNRPGRVLVFAGVAVAYLAAGKLGLALASVHPSATAVWAPTGIALAAFLRLGHRVWPAVFCAAFLVNVTTAGSIATSLGIAAGNTLEAAVGAYLITRFASASPSFGRPVDVFAFTALAALVSPAVSALFGVTSLALGGYARWADYGAIWATWWLGDAAGALIVAPPLLLWSAGRPLRLRWRRLGEALLMLLAVVAVGRAVFSNWLPAPVQRLEFLGIPALVWVSFRFGQREAVTATLVMSALAIWGTVQGVGPFAGAATSNAALLSLQAYMSVITLTALVVAAAVDDRRRADLARLDEARDRVRAHEALEKSEELHRAMAELASDFGVIVRVAPGGAVTLESATGGFRRVTGYEPDELAGSDDWRRLLDTASAVEAQSAGRRVLAGERVSLEVRIITRSGAARWLRCHVEPFGGEARADGVRILGAAEDITERRTIDEAIRRQREAIRELSTPVLRIRDRLLILPVIGEIDAPRAQHLTAELLRSIRTNRAKVVVIDMTGVAAMSPQVAQQIFSTIEACRLLGASIIMTGLSHGIADVLVSFGVDLGRVTSLGDLQSGMEEAERLLATDARGWAPSPVRKLAAGAPSDVLPRS